MNKNKKIISASLALALGVSLLIPNAKANEEKTVENALKEPVKTSEKVKTEEKSTVEDKKIAIKKAPVKEGGEEKPEGETEKPEGDPEKLEGDPEKPEGDPEKPEGETEKPEGDAEKPEGETEKPDGETEKPDGETEKPDGETEKPDDKKENSETDEEKPKDEKKVKPKEYKMSELLNEKGAFEKRKQAELDFLRFEIYNEERNEMGPNEEILRKMKLQYEKLPKATTWEEMGKILGYNKEYFARSILSMKIGGDAYDSELVKIIDDMANQKPQNPSKKNPNRKNKKTGTTNTANTANTGNKVNNAGENVQTGVGSLSAILGLLGASSLGLFKSKRK
ncbi:MAG: peptidase [Anaerococcus vaginalis]|uniref:peptidase n=1 Tax=Anaerococcus vaginalis TaxID=33037 RepID=UPI0028FE652C|nr:peptidase [Anaerococcus vaginalis]MDU1763641.1 peptidase [Anaerococcus vaginalis]